MKQVKTIISIDLIKRLAYLVVSFAYVILFIIFVKKKLLNVLVGIPIPISSLIFYSVGFIPPFYLLLLALLPREFEKHKEDEKERHWAIRLWLGLIPPPLALFGYNMSGVILIDVIGQYLYSKWLQSPNGHTLILGLIFVILAILYLVVSCIGTLRSAKQYGKSNLWVWISYIGVAVSISIFITGLAFTYFGINLFI